MTCPRIVVVGGGAGGLELATRLGRTLGKRKRADIILVDRNPTHIWKPLLHEVAVGALDTDLDAVSYQSHARQNGYYFQRGTLTGLDKESRTLTLAPIDDDEGNVVIGERTLNYDYLVMAVGSISNDFGTPGVRDNCYFLDSPQQAESFRQAMLSAFLKNAPAEDGQDGDKELTIAIVGAGATGVELSAELFNAVEMLHSYRVTGVDRQRLKVHIIEAADRILPALAERISTNVHQELTRLGVQIHTQTMVAKADEHGFETSTGERIDADLLVWAAGVMAPQFLSTLGLSTRRNNQIEVHQTMQSVDDPHIFAMGDCAACPQAGDKFVPPRAQAAHQMASTLYKNLVALLNGKEMKPFEYRDLGALISLSHFHAAGRLMRGASTRGLFIEGWLARTFYTSLYRMHQQAIFGTPRMLAKIVVDRLNHWLRPRLKLH